MARLSRKLRVCKWIGTVGCVLIVGEFAASWIVLQGYDWPSAQGPRGVWIGFGTIAFAKWPPADWLLSYGLHFEQLEGTDWPVANSALIPGVATNWYFEFFALPLWVILVPILASTLWLWRRDWRKPRPGFCRRCDYDLTGNTSGRCPECGMEITA
jgi:hypothetical protein